MFEKPNITATVLSENGSEGEFVVEPLESAKLLDTLYLSSAEKKEITL